jgi:hypothetical protein
MPIKEAPPFQRGETFYNGGTIDSGDLGGAGWEGKEFEFYDDLHGTGQMVTCRVVRNASGGALKPKHLVKYKTGYFGRRVDSPTIATAARGLPVDEKLPAAGVPDGDLFYVVVNGPAKIKSTETGTPTVTEGARVVAVTAATSGAADAGRIVAQDLTGATAALANNIQNAVGVALGALTAAQTATDLLVGVGW